MTDDILIRTATQVDLPTLLAFEQGIITAERPYDKTLKPDPISYYDISELIASNDAEVAVAVADGAIDRLWLCAEETLSPLRVSRVSRLYRFSLR